MEALEGFQPGEGPSKGLLCDNEPSCGPWFQALVNMDNNKDGHWMDLSDRCFIANWAAVVSRWCPGVCTPSGRGLDIARCGWSSVGELAAEWRSVSAVLVSDVATVTP